MRDALPPPRGGAALSSPTAVIGVGNRWLGDDAAGIEVARMLRATAPASLRVEAHEGEGSGLLEHWKPEDVAVIVDASSSGSAPGSIRRFDATHTALPAALLRSSTHAFGVAEAVELARALDRLPQRLLVYAIEGRSFAAGDGLSPEVERAVESLVAEFRRRPG